jgi:hypothetical protein
MWDVDMKATADDGLSLVGTLTLPAGPGPHPAVLLPHGSGRLDRDANTGRLRIELGRPLAATLPKNRIATLRYDRRGVDATPVTGARPDSPTTGTMPPQHYAS